MKSTNFGPEPRDLHARRVPWQTGASQSLARVIANLACGGAVR